MYEPTANKSQKLTYRRKIVMLGSDLRKLERAAAGGDMELRRMTRKKRTLQSQIDDLEKAQKKAQNEIRMVTIDLKRAKKQLDRIT